MTIKRAIAESAAFTGQHFYQKGIALFAEGVLVLGFEVWAEFQVI